MSKYISVLFIAALFVVTGLALKSHSGSTSPGDANGDGSINVLDITATVNAVLQINAPTGDADCNEDGQVNVLDITCVVNTVLSGSTPTNPPPTAVPTSPPPTAAPTNPPQATPPPTDPPPTAPPPTMPPSEECEGDAFAGAAGCVSDLFAQSAETTGMICFCTASEGGNLIFRIPPIFLGITTLNLEFPPVDNDTPVITSLSFMWEVVNCDTIELFTEEPFTSPDPISIGTVDDLSQTAPDKLSFTANVSEMFLDLQLGNPGQSVSCAFCSLGMLPECAPGL